MSRKTFLDQIARTARTERPAAPWARGPRRAAMIARRLAQQPRKTTAAR